MATFRTGLVYAPQHFDLAEKFRSAMHVLSIIGTKEREVAEKKPIGAFACSLHAQAMQNQL